MPLAQTHASAAPGTQFMSVGQSPSLTAVLTGSVDIVKLLLDRGADPQLSDTDDESVVDVAPAEGFHEIEALLGG